MPDTTACSAVDVDVIILSWNRVDDTLAAIDSALRQQGVRLNVLIVDQGTEARGLERLRRFIEPFDNVCLRELGSNVGVAAGRNLATAMGRSPYVVALDSDAIFANDRTLSHVVAEFGKRPDLGAIAFRITNFFTRKNDSTCWDYPAHCTPSERFSCSRFVGAGHALRRTAFERIGGYDNALFFCGEELDLCYRLLNSEYAIEYLPEAEVLHKVSPERRVFWGRGRYFFTVRNNLYTSYKFGVPPTRLMVAAAAFLLKGAVNGVVWDAARGVREAFRMGASFDRSATSNQCYRIDKETWRRIELLEPWRQERMGQKLRRQFRQLPTHA